MPPVTYLYFIFVSLKLYNYLIVLFIYCYVLKLCTLLQKPCVAHPQITPKVTGDVNVDHTSFFQIRISLILGITPYASRV